MNTCLVNPLRSFLPSTLLCSFCPSVSLLFCAGVLENEQLYNTTKLQFDHNIVAPGPTQQAALAAMFVAPFANPANYHLRPGSSPIGAGTSLDTPSIDITGKARTGAYDAGCYDYAD